jgi:predicted RNA-binding Zn ribbon-like protein
MTAGVASSPFDFSGGALCLDFVNTLGDRPRCTEEHLRDWTDLAAWGAQAGLLSGLELSRLRAGGGPDAERAFDRALTLRERLYGLFGALAAGRAPGRRDLAFVNDAIASALAHLRLEKHGDGFAWGWAAGTAPLDRVLWSVVRSTADLLVSPERTAVRECASGTCSWLFIDRSPTRRRRWCSMKTCGNRDKVRRFYERQGRA